MNKISAVIITLNEEEKLGACIDSLIDVADEIVVVDSFSTDNTKKIALEKGARFIEHNFEGYIAQKNFALTCAGYDYVLSLDADEVLSNELKKSIIDAKTSGFTHLGYSMNRLTFFEGKPVKHSGWYPDVKLRLFNRHKGKWQGLNPHDEFKFHQKSRVKHLKGDLLHYSFDSENEYLKQMQNFARLSAKSYYENRKNAGVLKIVVSPALRFIRDYFFNGGVWHGKTGLKICKYNAEATALKYRYLRQMYNERG